MTNIRVKPSQRGYCICYSNRLNKYRAKKEEDEEEERTKEV